LYAHAIKDLNNFSWGWRGINCALDALVNWIEQYHRVIFEPYVEGIRTIIEAV